MTRPTGDPWAEHGPLRDDLVSLLQTMDGLTETAYSDDGLVRVTVGAHGELKDLVLDPRIYRSSDAAILAATIVGTVNRAVAAAANRMVEMTEPLLPDGGLLIDRDADGQVDLSFDAMIRRLQPGGGDR